jgi:hypothetical protein
VRVSAAAHSGRNSELRPEASLPTDPLSAELRLSSTRWASNSLVRKGQCPAVVIGSLSRPAEN